MKIPINVKLMLMAAPFAVVFGLFIGSHITEAKREGGALNPILLHPLPLPPKPEVTYAEWLKQPIGTPVPKPGTAVCAQMRFLYHFAYDHPESCLETELASRNRDPSDPRYFENLSHHTRRQGELWMAGASDKMQGRPRRFKSYASDY